MSGRVTDESDPYGLPRFAGEDTLTDWVDHSEIALRTVRVFTRGPLTATVIAHPGVWDLIVSDGRGGVEFHALPSTEIAGAMTALGRRAG
ncbi:hypothetical protein NVV95_13560 [Herbiconiux sp. CPCC 205716]|uniref:Uncharacterized protein n=1 Tax=Herbiconiux gentiana TaxID=2970912 RepID=A0ABT2GH70_9MICO|nr:hypothetical protein [Herbiconiux gentiana]MCS5715573.1 hypothetical protein [Herbiconiux gentiana]